MNDLVRYSQRFIKRNASTILTCIGGAGVVATSVMAVKATPKALLLLEKAEKEKGEKLTKFEKVKVTGPAYIPAIITGATTIACVFGANMLNKRSQAALMSAYALIDNSYTEYKEKLKDLYGEEAHQNIIGSIAIEKADDDTFVVGSVFTKTCDLAVEENDGEPKLFYDEYGGRYFNATIEQVINAEYHLNRNYTLRGFSYLNEFYEFLGLETTDYGSVIGWARLDDGMEWIDFNHHKAVMDDGLECYIIEMPWAPSYDIEDW